MADCLISEDYDDMYDTIHGLEALNAELLAALIQMENWATHFSGLLNQTGAAWNSISLDGPFSQDAAKTRAVIAKAKELDQ